MPKAEKGSIKDLGKRMKAKGLQKLRFYCQMCEKQCRDANGFKCHLTSDSHLRNMKIFSDNSGRILKGNSREFETIFLDTLRMRHSTAKVNANQVYQQVISDKSHVHMNGTIWSTLSGFVQYLGKTGKCVVEETERGWYITYINRDVGKLQREEAQRERASAELEAEQTTQSRMEMQRVEAAKALDRAGGVLHEAPTTLENDVGKIDLSLKVEAPTKKAKKLKLAQQSVFGDSDDDDDADDDNTKKKESTAPVQPTKKRRFEGKPIPNTKAKPTISKDNAQDQGWLSKGIVVRIVNKKLGNGKYYRKKGTIDKLEDEFTAILSVEGDIIKLDQDDLETVVPKKPGESILIVRGRHRGATAIVSSLNKEKCRADLDLKGEILRKVDYDNFSKLA